MISVQCTACGTRYKARDDLAGKKVKCKHCGVVFSMPPAATEAADESERPAADNGTHSEPQLTIRDRLPRSLGNISRRLADPDALSLGRLFRTKRNIIWLAVGGSVLAVVLLLLIGVERGADVIRLVLSWGILGGGGAALYFGIIRPRMKAGQRRQEMRPPIKCPLCSHEGLPVVTKTVSGAGWVLFVILLLSCCGWPFIWFPFVISGCLDETRSCAACGSKVG